MAHRKWKIFPRNGQIRGESQGRGRLVHAHDLQTLQKNQSSLILNRPLKLTPLPVAPGTKQGLDSGKRMDMLPSHETDLYAFDARCGGAFAQFLRAAWRAGEDDRQSGELRSELGRRLLSGVRLES
jgi:hypothetical protein